MLQITNGDSAAATPRQAGLGGTVLPWRDILHEGPAPADLSFDAPRATRDRFLAQRLALTEMGHAVLRGEQGWNAPSGGGRWLGGVQLEGDGAAWRWERRAGRLARGKIEPRSGGNA